MFSEEFNFKAQCQTLLEPIGSTSVSHQCGPGSIPDWGSDPDAISEKDISCLSYPPSLSGDDKPFTYLMLELGLLNASFILMVVNFLIG